MAANSSTSVVDLDFSTIKNNLITFLKAQTKLKDYDYTGSNINVILDVLAYNTFMQNYYINMIASEMFLDTATLKDSVISHAKELNYLPRSALGAKAIVNVKVIPPVTATPSSINLDRYTKFNTTIAGTTYSFHTEDDYIILPTSDAATGTTVWSISNVEIYEGILTKEFFTVDSTNNYTITISNSDADLTFLRVNVRESNTVSTNSEWTQARTLFNVNAVSNVYYVEPARDDKFNITFGDGTFGRKPSLGNIVEVTYRVASKEEGNGGRTFTCASVDNYTNVVVTTVANSLGGFSAESISDIKRNAPKSYQVQERAVTADDFKILTQAKFPEVENILAFGGENLVPPRFGKVILAVDLSNADGVPETKKREIATYLEKRTPVGIDVEVITPNFLFVDTSLDVTYNIGVTTLAPASIKAKAVNGLLAYANANINRFESTWRDSKATAAVDSSDSSIISSQLLTRPFIKLFPNGLTTSYKLEFNNKLKKDSVLISTTSIDTYEPAISSSVFTYSGNQSAYFLDDGAGNLSIVTNGNGNVFVVLKRVAGSINYDTGLVTILPIAISSYVGQALKVYARTLSKDFKSIRQTILQLNAEDISVNVIQERI